MEGTPLANPLEILAENLMHTARRLHLSFLVCSFLVLALPVFAQQVIATVPVGPYPQSSAVNPVTNKIYVVNNNCIDYPNPCAGNGTVTVIDGATLATNTVTVGSNPYGVAVNPITNQIYVANICGNDVTCSSYSGTVTVIDGVSLTTTTVSVGANPYVPVVNSVTNKIYVPNACGNDPTCASPYSSGTVTVIDGATNNPTSVTVGILPDALDVNTASNQIYVANECGDDPYCASTATMTVIDGASLATTDVAIGGYYPYAIAVNSVTNKIYVPSQCFGNPSCQGDPNGTVTVVDGASLAITNVAIGGNYPFAIAVNSVTNKIYVSSDCFGDPSCQGEPNGTVTVIDGVTLATVSVPVGVAPATMAVDTVTNKIYVANQCGSDPSCALGQNGTVTVIDGATLAFTNIGVGNDPYGLALNSATNRVYVPNYYDGTVSVIDGTPALQFVPLSQPCRAVDTRPSQGGGGPIQGGTHQDFPISGAGDCGVLTSAAAFSLNVTVVPQGSLGYLTIWPAGQPQPVVSTLNSLDGRIKADAAILPAGANGEISVYVTDTTNVIVDVNGYFAPVSGSTLAFYPLLPCRVADTRHSGYPQGLGPPSLTGGQERAFPILNATTCNIPPSAAAYSLNFTVVPHGGLGYLTVWPTGQTRPTVSTLNDIGGQIIANAAIVVAGAGSQVSVYPTNDTDLAIDIDGYFAAAGQGGLSLYGVQPCRVIDTRKIGSGLPFSGTLSPPVDVMDSPCSVPSTAQAYVFNTSVVPQGALGYLTLWPDGATQPLVSTLNAVDATISSNMAIVPTNNGSVDAYASGLTQLILDISSYFAP
jgi:DNA-binding beta-propeller fold protein YncE